MISLPPLTPEEIDEWSRALACEPGDPENPGSTSTMQCGRCGERDTVKFGCDPSALCHDCAHEFADLGERLLAQARRQQPEPAGGEVERVARALYEHDATLSSSNGDRPLSYDWAVQHRAGAARYQALARAAVSALPHVARVAELEALIPVHCPPKRLEPQVSGIANSLAHAPFAYGCEFCGAAMNVTDEKVRFWHSPACDRPRTLAQARAAGLPEADYRVMPGTELEASSSTRRTGGC